MEGGRAGWILEGLETMNHDLVVPAFLLWAQQKRKQVGAQHLLNLVMTMVHWDAGSDLLKHHLRETLSYGTLWHSNMENL